MATIDPEDPYDRKVLAFVRQQARSMNRGRNVSDGDLIVRWDHAQEAFAVTFPRKVELVGGSRRLATPSDDPTAPVDLETRVIESETYYVTAEVVRRAVPPPDPMTRMFAGLIEALADAERARQRRDRT